MKSHSSSSASSSNLIDFNRELPQYIDLDPDVVQPPAVPHGSGQTETDGSVDRPEMKSKKRKRELAEGMEVDGASGDESGDPSGEEGVESPTKSTRSEPAIKRRRTMSVDDATRQCVSDAIAGGDLEALKKILDACPECLNHQHADSKATPLLEAVWWGRIGIVRWLLEQGGDPNILCKGFDEDKMSDESHGLDEALIQHYIPRMQELQKFSSSGADILGQSALLHAAFHGDLELAKLLVSFQAKVNIDDGDVPPIWGAMAGRRTEMVCFLLQQGADPTARFHDWVANDRLPLSMALETSQLEVFRKLMAHIAGGEAVAAVKAAITESVHEVSLECMENLIPLLLEFNIKILEIESPSGQSWLLELMLDRWCLEIARFLMDQGFVYKVRSDKDLTIAANVSPDKELVSLMLKGIESPELQNKFVNQCLYRNLYFQKFHGIDQEISDCNEWLIVDSGASPYYVPVVPIDLGDDDPGRIDYSFHTAVAVGARAEVESFLRIYGIQRLHVPGKLEKFPIEIAAEVNNNSLFFLSLNHLSAGDRHQSVRHLLQFFERAAIKNQNARAYDYMKQELMRLGVNPGSELLTKVIRSHHWRSLEFLCVREENSGISLSTDLLWPSNPSDRLIINDLFFRTSLLVKNLDLPLNAFSHSKAPNSAIQILDALSRQLEKDGEKFRSGCLKLGRQAGIAGVITERSIETQSMLGFIRHALLGDARKPDGFASQFSNFIAYWLPATDAWHWYLSSKEMYNNPTAPSADFCLDMTRLSCVQLNDLHQAGKRRQEEWARQIFAELPALCLRCVDTKSDDVDKAMLERELIQRDIVAPNAIRLANLMQRAYRAASALSNGVLQSPALQSRQFAAQFATEMAKLMGDDDDKGITQRATADAMLLINQEEYRRLHLPQGMAIEFQVQAVALLSDLVCWQMDAIFNCFGKAVDGQADAYAKEYGPFLKFFDELKNNIYFFSDKALRMIRPDLVVHKLGSGFRNLSECWNTSEFLEPS